jgi:hypothetical protein
MQLAIRTLMKLAIIENILDIGENCQNENMESCQLEFLNSSLELSQNSINYYILQFELFVFSTRNFWDNTKHFNLGHFFDSDH